MDCNRCGGCGQFSYNDVDGTRCYGCAGSGWQYTPKGKREFKKWKEAVEACRATKISDVQVGDKISLTRGQSTQREFATVLEVERQLRTADESPWSSGSVNGVLVFESRERIVLSAVFKSGATANHVYDQPETLVQVSRGRENEPQPNEYAARALSTKVKK